MLTFANWLAEAEAQTLSWFSASSFCIAKTKLAGTGGIADKASLLALCRSLKNNPDWTQDQSWNIPKENLYGRLSRRQWKLRVHEWARQNNASEWIAYVSNNPVERQFWWKSAGLSKGAFEGSDGVWSYCLAGMPRKPRDADLKLRVMQLKDEKGWMNASLPLGRDTFTGFVKHWRREVNPVQWIAFARVEGLGSIRYIERREGLKPSRPDIGNVELWWLPKDRAEEEIILTEA